nr:bestrophin [Hymenolepis microstoma]
MSVSYLDDVSDGSGTFIFLKLLVRWKGSLYKLVWLDLLGYLFIHYLIQLIYWVVLNTSQRTFFNEIVDYCEQIRGQVPVSFLLGFFVSGVIGRWFDTYMYIPWLNDISYQIASAVNCADPRVALRARLTVMRYLNLSWILMMRTISDRISNRFRQQSTSPGDRKRQRFLNISDPKATNSKDNTGKRPTSPLLPNPTSSDYTTEQWRNSSSASGVFSFNGTDNDPFEAPDDDGIRETLKSFNNDKKVQQTFGKIITEAEIRAFENIARRHFYRSRKRYLPEYWVPIQWAVRVVQKVTLHGCIPDSKIMVAVCNELGRYRHSLQQLKTFSSLAMPLVYTQVAVIAVYSYFLCQIIATQYTERIVNETVVSPNMSLPLFSIFYFIFLIGWLKVALCVMNPFGEDYEDFETSEILDYNLDVSHRIVLMDETTYPEELKRATFAVRTIDGFEDDNLSDFLDSVARDLDDVQFDENAYDIHNLEIRPSFFSRLKERFMKTTEKSKRFVDDRERIALPNPLSY